METGDICIFKYFCLPLLCVNYKDMEDKKYKLYSLNDETGIRYIGITKQKLSYRLSGHISSCKQAFKNKRSRHHRHCWIKSLLNKGILPTISLITEFDCPIQAKQAEINTIKLYKNLVNTTAGGDGIREYKFSQKHLDSKRFKVDQYDLHGNFLCTFKSLSEASLIITGTEKNNGKISAVTKGKLGRRTAFGYIWRIHGEAFNKYPTASQWRVTEAQKKALSKRQLENNVMKNKKGLLNSTSKPVLILNADNIIINITETVKEVSFITKLSKSCINKMLKLNKEIASYKLAYANKDIVQSLQKCKSSTLKAFIGQKYNLEVDC